MQQTRQRWHKIIEEPQAFTWKRTLSLVSTLETWELGVLAFLQVLLKEHPKINIVGKV